MKQCSGFSEVVCNALGLWSAWEASRILKHKNAAKRRKAPRLLPRGGLGSGYGGREMW